MSQEVSGRLAELGLSCNPFKALYPEQLDPCKLVVVGRRHREALDSIVKTLIDPNEPSKLVILTGKWGVGKTAVSKRAICEARRHGVDVISIYVQPILPVLSYDALLLEAARRLYYTLVTELENSDLKRLGVNSVSELVNNYEAIGEYVKYCCGGTSDDAIAECPACAGGPYRKKLEEYFLDKKKIIAAKNEFKDLVKYVTMRLRRPIYIIFDQFDELVKVDTDIRGQNLRDFLLTVKDVIHSLAELSRKIRNAKVVFVKSIISSVFMGRYSRLLENSQIRLEQLFGGHFETLQLGPFESSDEVAELVARYLELNRECILDTALLVDKYALFDEEAMAALYKWSRGLPREVLVLAEKVVDEAGKIGARRPLRADFVAKVAIKEEIGSIGEHCIGKEAELLGKLVGAKDPRGLLFTAIMELYQKLRNIYRDDEFVRNYILMWADKTYLFIAKANKDNIKDNYAALVTLSKRVDKRVVKKMNRVLDEEIKSLGLDDYVPVRKLVMLLLEYKISSEAQNLIYKLQQEHGIVIEPVNITDDEVAKLVTACIMYFKEHSKLVEGELTPEAFVRMLERGYRIASS